LELFAVARRWAGRSSRNTRPTGRDAAQRIRPACATGASSIGSERGQRAAKKKKEVVAAGVTCPPSALGPLGPQSDAGGWGWVVIGMLAGHEGLAIAGCRRCEANPTRAEISAAARSRQGCDVRNDQRSRGARAAIARLTEVTAVIPFVLVRRRESSIRGAR